MKSQNGSLILYLSLLTGILMGFFIMISRILSLNNQVQSLELNEQRQILMSAIGLNMANPTICKSLLKSRVLARDSEFPLWTAPNKLVFPLSAGESPAPFFIKSSLVKEIRASQKAGPGKNALVEVVLSKGPEPTAQRRTFRLSLEFKEAGAGVTDCNLVAFTLNPQESI